MATSVEQKTMLRIIQIGKTTVRTGKLSEIPGGAPGKVSQYRGLYFQEDISNTELAKVVSELGYQPGDKVEVYMTIPRKQ